VLTPNIVSNEKVSKIMARPKKETIQELRSRMLDAISELVVDVLFDKPKGEKRDLELNNRLSGLRLTLFEQNCIRAKVELALNLVDQRNEDFADVEFTVK
jgi:hypothetical protein